MSDSESFRSAKVQSRAAIWSALIGSIGVVAAAWIGLGIGRSQSDDKLQQGIRQRNTEIEALRGDLQAQKAALEQVRKALKAERQGASTPPGPEKGDDENASLSARISDVEYRVESSQHMGQELQVWLVATNQGANLETAIYFASSLTDASGNEHRQSARMAGGKRGGLDWFWLTLPHNVPTRFGLAFDSVPPTIDSIPYIRIRMRDQGWLEFRNIPVPYGSSH